MRARKDRETKAHLPEGTLVAVAGGKNVGDPAIVTAYLDKTRAKHSDIVLVHGGGPGVEKVAARWAERNGVDQVVCKPDWDAHGRAAPFRAQRRAPEPPAQGRHRLPRQRNHRQPRRQSHQAGYASRPVTLLPRAMTIR